MERMKVRVQVAQLVSHSDREIWPFGTFEVEPALIRLTGAVEVRRRAIVMFDGWTIDKNGGGRYTLGQGNRVTAACEGGVNGWAYQPWLCQQYPGGFL